MQDAYIIKPVVFTPPNSGADEVLMPGERIKINTETLECWAGAYAVTLERGEYVLVC